MNDLQIFNDIRVYDTFCNYLIASIETYSAIANGTDEQTVNMLRNTMYKLEYIFKELEEKYLNGTNLQLDKYFNILSNYENEQYSRAATLYSELVDVIFKSYHLRVSTNFK